MSEKKHLSWLAILGDHRYVPTGTQENVTRSLQISLAILFPITTFVAAGFEHSIANMYFIPMGILLAEQPAVLGATGVTAEGVANLTWAGFVGNLVPVTIGNIVGGTQLLTLITAIFSADWLKK